MKHILFLVALLFLGSIATASEVAELAKQEKARREALTKQGVQSRVLTNADIPNLKSTLAMEVTGAPEVVLETASPSEPPNAPSANEQKKQELVEEINAHRAEIEELKQEIAEQRKAAAEGGPYRSRDFGSQHRTIREQEELLRDMEQDLSGLEAEKEEE